jgi:hypothetical protein
LRAIWLTTFVSILPGLLDLASPVAANAIFSLTAMALDLSYVIPIFCRRVFADHPDVMFKPGPFYMGKGYLGIFCNVVCILWTLFICVIFSLPTFLPVTPETMNYASVSSFRGRDADLYGFSIVFILEGHHWLRHYTCIVSVLPIITFPLTKPYSLSFSVWYFAAARRHYIGPQSNLHDASVEVVTQDTPTEKEKEKVMS